MVYPRYVTRYECLICSVQVFNENNYDQRNWSLYQYKTNQQKQLNYSQQRRPIIDPLALETQLCFICVKLFLKVY